LKDSIVFTFLTSVIETSVQRKGKPDKRRNKWRSILALCQKNDRLEVSAFYLLYEKSDSSLLKEATSEIAAIASHIKVMPVAIEFKKAHHFPSVYLTLYDYFDRFKFKTESRRYYFLLGRHQILPQIALFKLADSSVFPGKFIHAESGQQRSSHTEFHVVDPDLSSADWFNAKFNSSTKDAIRYLKLAIDTKNDSYNEVVKRLEKIALKTSSPILLTGAEGVGKSELASRLFSLKQQRGLIEGKLVQVNCATLAGDNGLMSLFGRVDTRSGNPSTQDSLVNQANKGMLILDEISALPINAQETILQALEQGSILPLGSTTRVASVFQLIVTSRQSLGDLVCQEKFHSALYAKLSLWSFHLPSLSQRVEDFESHLVHLFKQLEKKQGKHIRFHADAKAAYLQFAVSSVAAWSGNFRDLETSVTRMTVLAKSGIIDKPLVDAEISLLTQQWSTIETSPASASAIKLSDYLSPAAASTIDDFDIPQLKHVIWVCQQSRSAADAGRRLFNHSRVQKRSSNDTSRLARYLSKFDLQFQDICDKDLQVNQKNGEKSDNMNNY